jgi:hypothetical protein
MYQEDSDSDMYQEDSESDMYQEDSESDMYQEDSESDMYQEDSESEMYQEDSESLLNFFFAELTQGDVCLYCVCFYNEGDALFRVGVTGRILATPPFTCHSSCYVVVGS